jgi:hypothetical protein
MKRSGLVLALLVGAALLIPCPVAASARAIVEVRIDARGELDAAGEASIHVRGRCMTPWVVSNLSVQLTQGSDTGLGNSHDFGLECTGHWFRRAIRVIPAPGSFEAGAAHAAASFTVHDPLTGDPVATTTPERDVSLTGMVEPVLWDQTGTRAGARASADLVGTEFDSQGADDFVVPAGQTWSVTEVYAPGSNGSSHPEPFLVPGVNVFVYADAGTVPGALIAAYPSVSPTTAPDDLTIPLSPALTLGPGTYWISVQADLSSLTLQDSWGWAFRNAVTGDQGVWRNPGGGFGGPLDWAPTTDFEFDLRGTSAAA